MLNYIIGAATMFDFLKKKKKEPENLAEIFRYFEKLENNFEELSKEVENLKKESKFSLQKIGILRYNPFSDVGSNQSFSIAILDGRDDGLVITSLYAREGNRIYGKPIKGGNSEYSLSKEEKEAIKIAQTQYDNFGSLRDNSSRPSRDGRSCSTGQNKNGDKNKRKFNNPAAGSGGYGSC